MNTFRKRMVHPVYFWYQQSKLCHCVTYYEISASMTWALNHLSFTQPAEPGGGKSFCWLINMPALPPPPAPPPTPRRGRGVAGTVTAKGCEYQSQIRNWKLPPRHRRREEKGKIKRCSKNEYQRILGSQMTVPWQRICHRNCWDLYHHWKSLFSVGMASFCVVCL